MSPHEPFIFIILLKLDKYFHVIIFLNIKRNNCLKLKSLLKKEHNLVNIA